MSDVLHGTRPVSSTGEVTIYDVARLAGVTPMTVSRALSGKPGVSSARREQIQRIAEAHSYRPNLGAQAMKSQRSMQVGLLLENRPEKRFTHTAAWHFLLGINEGLEQGGYITSLVRIHDMENENSQASRALRSHLLDGLIVINALPRGFDELVARTTSNIVWLDANVWKEERCIRRDEFEAGKLCVEALYRAGFKRQVTHFQREHNPVHFSHFSIQERRDGIRVAAQELGVELIEVDMRGRSVLSGWDLIEPHISPDVGLILVTGYEVNNLLQVLAERELVMGRDVSFVCCDDHVQLASHHWDRIAAVEFDRFGMGVLAAQMMMKILEDPDASTPSVVCHDKFRPGVSVRQPKTCEANNTLCSEL